MTNPTGGERRAAHARADSGGRRADAAGRGTPVQRIRARLVESASWMACRLPEGILVGLADAVGLLWYRIAPARAAQSRRNLRRVAEWLEAEGRGTPGARAAAADDRALERLVRAAFRQQARYYLELLRVPAMDARYVQQRLTIETPLEVEEAFGGDGGLILVGAHFGALELPGLMVAALSGKQPTAPMETIDDPPLQAFFVRTRSAVGVRLIGLEAVRSELLAALRRKDPVGLVADRDIAGGGHLTRFFGHPAPLPIGAALLAIESGAATYVAGVRRIGVGRYAAKLLPLPVPSDGKLREKVTAILDAEARAFEYVIADAPEQWWGSFFPIWPDLEAAP